MKKPAIFSRRGFTLIELLIVIALLGALAIGLLATIDPFEQLKKGKDTSTRNTVSEFYDALIRYYSSKNDFPWIQTSANEPSANAMALNNTTALGWISSLEAAGELKQGFANLAGTGNLAGIYVFQPVTDKVAVCFAPQSRSFQIDPNSIYDNKGNTSGVDCKGSPTADTSATGCYYCVQ